MSNIARRLVGRYAVLLSIAAVVMGGFELITTAVVSTLNMPELIGGVLAVLPPNIALVLGDQVFGGLGTTGMLGFGWNHPIAHSAGTAVAVVLGARAVAGEVENGTLELVLAQPISRRAYLTAHIAFAVVALTLLCAAGAVGTLVGARMFAIEDVSVVAVASVAVNFLLLLFALYAATLLASAFGREGGRALGMGVLLAVTSFLVHTVALLWSDVSGLRPFALHTYYAPRDVLAAGTIPFLSIAVLGGWALVCSGAALWRFARRDIP